MDKKKLTLPIKIIIIGFIIGLVVAGIGGVREPISKGQRMHISRHMKIRKNLKKDMQKLLKN